VGMVAVTDTYICTSCKEIVDVLVGEFGQTFRPDIDTESGMQKATDSEFFKCPECGSKDDLVIWHTDSRPCPKCDGQMVLDEDGETIMWD
jgi:hypothetical protein